MSKGGKPTAGDPTPGPAGDRRSYQDGPAYREHLERLRREGRQRPATNYDEPVAPLPLDSLDATGGWDGTIRPATRPAVAPPPGYANDSTTAPLPSHNRPDRAIAAPREATPLPAAAGGGLVSGDIVALDDGSVAIFKDAVSGKDYALFYFLERDGRCDARGIFMEQYGRTIVGRIGEELFAQMRDRKRWDRDAIVFHLNRYDHAGLIPRIVGAAPAAGSGTAESQSGLAADGPRGNRVPTGAPTATRPPTGSVQRLVDTPSSVGGGRRRDSMLERGRVLRINIGGKIWESVYWTEDEMGAILAHDTNKSWALMHLDLKRFRESLEYGDVVGYERLSEIEASLANQRK